LEQQLRAKEMVDSVGRRKGKKLALGDRGDPENKPEQKRRNG